MTAPHDPATASQPSAAASVEPLDGALAPRDLVAAAQEPAATPLAESSSPTPASRVPLGSGSAKLAAVEAAAEPVPPPPLDWPRFPPAPRSGGPVALARFVLGNHLFHLSYARGYLRFLRHKVVHRGRLQTDGPCFIGRGVAFDIGPEGVVSLGRWSWIGDRTKLRAHAGRLEIGAKTVVGQECTFSTYESITVGRECIVADRSMFIDFDHAVMMIETPIRQQGLYSRPVRVGHNVWVGYGACFLRGTTTGNNSIVGTYSVVTKDLPENSVAVGAPAKVVRFRDAPTRMHWVD